MGDWGLKISTDGNDVKTQDTKDLVFNSEFSTLKLIDQGSTSITVTNGSTTASQVLVTHNLGYRPWSQVFPNIGGKRYNGTSFVITRPDVTTSGGSTSAFIWTDVSTTQIIFELDLQPFTASGDQTFDVYWYYAVDTGQA